MRKALATSLAALLVSCNGVPPPNVDCRILGCREGTECKEVNGVYRCVPIEPPPPPECLPGIPWCHEVDQSCSLPDKPCKHNPSSDPNHCELAPDCEAPPPPPPDPGVCPKEFTGNRVYMRHKDYGNGQDSTVRVTGDPQFCYLIHGVPVNDCHLEGWVSRAACEIALLGKFVGKPYACPVWEYKTSDNPIPHLCVDDTNPALPASCDHFGDPVNRDDPKTPTTGDTLETLQGFEGRPLECGLQRDSHGPIAGFFVIAHGKGDLRACRPDGLECSPWKPFEK